MNAPSSPSGPPVLYAHRGARAERPENTLAAFRRAIEAGADALELDVRMTADAEVVVSHDPTGARTCGVAAEIRRTALAELRSWDAGYGFVEPAGDRPFAGRGLRIPTLEEVLVELPGVPLNVDIKQRRPEMVEPLLRLLRRLGAEGRVRLASFSARTLGQVRRLGYRGRTALARAEVARLLLLPWPGTPPAGADRAQLPLRYGPLVLARPGVIARFHALGLGVDFWVVDDPAQARALLEMGADGIFTDDPRALFPVFAERRGKRA